MTTVCLPDADFHRLTQPLPDGVEVIEWDGHGDPPDGLDRVEFLVPSFGGFDGAQITALLEGMTSLKVVQALSAGVDYLVGRVPDGITLCDGRGVHGSSTSEWVLTAILASVRDFPDFVRAQERHEWDRHETDELSGKQVLIVGAGDLGEQTARRLRAFDAEPVMVARHAREGVHGIDEVADLLPHADVVVLVIPMTEQTRGLVDRDFLAGMKDGALLVNGARGPVVDTDALVAELRSGRLRAALDVTDPEPLPADHPLWDAPNLLLTPHVGGNVVGFPKRAARLVREQIERFARGEQLHNVVEGDY